jgi:hypothetical protein
LKYTFYKIWVTSRKKWKVSGQSKKF